MNRPYSAAVMPAALLFFRCQGVEKSNRPSLLFVCRPVRIFLHWYQSPGKISIFWFEIIVGLGLECLLYFLRDLFLSGTRNLLRVRPEPNFQSWNFEILTPPLRSATPKTYSDQVSWLKTAGKALKSPENGSGYTELGGCRWICSSDKIGLRGTLWCVGSNQKTHSDGDTCQTW